MSITDNIQRLGRWASNYCAHLGRGGVFLFKTLTHWPKPSQFFALTAVQIYQVGVLSLIIILLSGLFIGMVVALQGYNTLVKFSASQELGQMLALSIVRELGPVVTELLFAGRAGSALTAELGLMRATEQLDCMEMMAVDPLPRIVAPRFWAGCISMPLLGILFNLVAVYGGYLVGVCWLGVDSGSFWGNMRQAVDFHSDIMNGILKSVIFGIVVTWIAVYQGYYSEPHALGISRATTRTVVYSSLAILGLDFILTALMMGGW